ncbi:MAG: Undecaprenyl-diphosphatase [Frankiales bacterium]|nr:Undecaprenyl-diphosphatase [Frankiales bacterium]
MGFRAINDFAKHTQWLHTPAKLFANYGVVVFALLLVLGLVLNRSVDLRAVSRSALAGVGVLVAVAINQPIVHAVGEPRPFTKWPDALVLVHRSADASFPSDHSVMAGATAVGLLLSRRRLGWACVPLALLMAADRIYVGAHYPLDVIAGLAVGGIVAAGIQALAPLVAHLLHRVRLLPGGSLLLAGSAQPVLQVRPRDGHALAQDGPDTDGRPELPERPDRV